MDSARFSSLCDSSPYNGDCEVSMYEHRHCSVCRAPLFAVGGGGDDGSQTAGYDDEHGNSARICAACDDDFFLLCPSCAKVDSRCGACRAAALAVESCDPATCDECRQGAA